MERCNSETMETSTHCPLTEHYIDTKLLVYLKYCTLYKRRKASNSKFLPCYVRYRPLKRVLKGTKKFKSTTMCRHVNVQYENIIKGSKPKSNKNIFDVFVSQRAILNFTKYRVISPFSDMTLHFFDTTTTGY